MVYHTRRFDYAVTFNLAQSAMTGSGPEGRDVTFTFDVSFKAPAAGRVYTNDICQPD